MASISTIVRIQDGFSNALQSMTRSTNMALSSFEELQRTSEKAVNTTSIKTARAELVNVEMELENIKSSMDDAGRGQDDFTESVEQSNDSMDGLKQTAMQVAAVVGSIVGAKKLLEMSDSLVSTNARLDLINDGLQTQAELQDEIYASARRSRAGYEETASAVARLGMNAKDAFNSTKEIVHFSELLNKTFVASGAEVSEMNAAMHQLSQAMASGRLQGDEFVSIAENAPKIMQYIADYLEVPKGALKEMGAEGALTADIIKNAMFEAAEDIDNNFKTIPATFEQLWQVFKDTAMRALQPALEKLSEFANTEAFQQLLDNVAGMFAILSDVIIVAVNIISNAVQWMAENWEWLRWVLLGVAIVVGVTLVAAWGSAAIAALAAAWPLLIIAGIIAVIILLFTKFRDVGVAVLGTIVGAVFGLGMVFQNIGKGIANFAIAVAERFVNVWNLAVYAVKMVWYTMYTTFMRLMATLASGLQGIVNMFLKGVETVINTVLSGINAVIGLINKIPGVNIGAVGEVSLQTKGDWGAGWQAKADAAIKPTYQKTTFDRFEYGSVSDAYDKGYKIGEGAGNKFGDFLGGIGDTMSSLTDKVTGAGVGGMDPSMFGPGADDPLGKDTNGKVGGIGKDTKAIKKSMDIAQEDLKYLRDIAEQEVINRFTLTELKVEINNENKIDSELDIDGIVESMNGRLTEEMASMAEGV